MGNAQHTGGGAQPQNGSAANRRGKRRSVSTTLASAASHNGGGGGSSHNGVGAGSALPSSSSHPAGIYASDCSGAGANFPPPQTSIIADKEPLTSTQKQLVRQCWLGITKRSGGAARGSDALPSTSNGGAPPPAPPPTTFAAKKDPVSFGEKVLSRVIIRQPEFKELFGWENYQNNRQLYATAEFQKHAQLIESTIHEVVVDIEHMEESVRPKLFQIGQRHALISSQRASKQHIQTIHWDFVSEAVLKVVAESRVRNPQGLVAAWRILICWIINLLRDGFLTGQFAIKVQRRRMSAPLLHIAQHNATYMRCTANARGSRGDLSDYGDADYELDEPIDALDEDDDGPDAGRRTICPISRRSHSLQATPRRHNNGCDTAEHGGGNGELASSTRLAFERLAAEIHSYVDHGGREHDDDGALCGALPPPAGGDVPL